MCTLDLTLQFCHLQAVAMVCGFMVVVALAVAAFFSFRTRSKIWHYGKPNIYWDRPLMGGSEGRDVEDWVSFLITPTLRRAAWRKKHMVTN